MTTLNVMIATDLMGITLQDHVVVAGGSGSIYSYRTELKDRFSIEGLSGIVERSADKRIMTEHSEEYKPLAKVEELEEQNYNQIDNVINNVKPASREKPKKLSIIEDMKRIKAQKDAEERKKRYPFSLIWEKGQYKN